MVGHTHEDIDSKFGTLWKHIRSKSVLSPQQYKTNIVKALSTKTHRCEVKDVLVVPDYKAVLDQHIDSSFSPWTKMDKTQLQWTFTAVTPDEYFKHGVQIFYRAFASDRVCCIIEDKNKPCGVYAKECDVFDYPMKVSLH